MKGFLFIGDPHVSSRAPGRRHAGYTAGVLEKLRVAREIAKDQDLLPVILGDLFHKADENDLETLSKLIAIVKGMLCVGGNHDKKDSLLSGTDALHLLDQAGVIRVIDGDCQLAEVLDTPEGPVHLWVAPYGAKLPEKIDRNGAHKVVLVTHHDLAFAGAYPGAAGLREIPGCDMVVNGHMHKTAPSVTMGSTVWHNPGNIEPLSVDCIDHKPAVWAWHFEQDGKALERFDLPHQRDCFDMTGLQVVAAPANSAVRALESASGDASATVPPSVVDIAPVLPSSHFAELLSEQFTTMEANRKEDNTTFVADLQEGFSELAVPGVIQDLLLGLAEKLDLRAS